MKKLLSIAAITALILSMSSVTSAAVTPGIGSHDVEIQVTAEASVMDISIPSGDINVHVLADGNATGPSEMRIANNGTATVKITDIQYSNTGSWELLSTLPSGGVGSKKFTGKIDNITGFTGSPIAPVTGTDIRGGLPNLVGLEIAAPAAIGTPNIAKITFDSTAWKGTLSNTAIATPESGGKFVFTFE